MSEIRQDPTTEEWVIVAKERAKRPHDFVHQQARPELPVFSPSCPFCPGNESMTPSETLAYRDKENQRWRNCPYDSSAERPYGNRQIFIEKGR